MSRDDMEAIAKAAAKEAVQEFSERNQGKCGLCLGEEFAERHRKHHEFIDSWIMTLGRWEDVKWSTIREVAKWLTIGTLAGIIAYFGLKLQ